MILINLALTRTYSYTILGYWSGLWASTDFTGKKLKHCLDTIHYDIIVVWNFPDESVGLLMHRAYARDL